MKTVSLGSHLDVTRIAQGCMRLSEDEAVARRTLHAALDAGITFFDHADIYGGGQREATFSALWEDSSSLRQEIVLQSKCGIRFAGDPSPTSVARYDFAYDHIVSAVEGSLRRLKTDYLDVLLLHRPDPLVEPEEVARAFDHLHREGMVRHVGVSNHTGAQIALLKTAVEQPLVANQLQVALTHTQLIDEGVVMNSDNAPNVNRNHGTLEYCRLNDITLQAWSPLGGGYLSGRDTNGQPDNVVETAALVAELAAEYGVAPEAIVAAWLLRHPCKMQVVIGTTNPTRIAGACQADGIELSREAWWRLYVSARGCRIP